MSTDQLLTELREDVATLVRGALSIAEQRGYEGEARMRYAYTLLRSAIEKGIEV